MHTDASVALKASAVPTRSWRHVHVRSTLHWVRSATHVRGDRLRSRTIGGCAPGCAARKERREGVGTGTGRPRQPTWLDA